MTMKHVTTEQAFDMLPYVSDIYTKLDIQSYLKKNTIKAKKGEDPEELKKVVGANLIAYILKNSPKIKVEFFNIIAIFEGKETEEIMRQSLISTVASFKAILSDEELMGFFKQSV